MTTEYIRATLAGNGTLYTCPAGKTAIVAFCCVTETNNNANGTYNLWLTDHANSDAARYFAKDAAIGAHASIHTTAKGLILNAGDTLACGTRAKGAEEQLTIFSVILHFNWL